MEYGNERDQSAAIQRDFFQGFHDIVAAFEAAIGHTDMNWFGKNVAAAKTFAELERSFRERMARRN